MSEQTKVTWRGHDGCVMAVFCGPDAAEKMFEFHKAWQLMRRDLMMATAPAHQALADYWRKVQLVTGVSYSSVESRDDHD